MKARFVFLFAAAVAVAPSTVAAADASPFIAAQAINALGLDLLRQPVHAAGNFVFSPYSIQSALAMTYAGADGVTRKEMAAALHYPEDEPALHAAFAALNSSLAATQKLSIKSNLETNSLRERLVADGTAQGISRSEIDGRLNSIFGEPEDTIDLVVGNRLFGNSRFNFSESFLSGLRDTYGAPLETIDFVRDPEAARLHINSWVAAKTRQRIRELLQPRAVDKTTALVLVNTVYLKAPWEKAFEAKNTEARPFRLGNGETVLVATMTNDQRVGFAQRQGYSVVTINYSHGLQFTVFIPDQPGSLAQLEGKLTQKDFEALGDLQSTRAHLFLPKLHLAPPSISLAKELQSLGMKSAFDVPSGSANFDRMAPRIPGNTLRIDDVIHQAFINLNEKGTEAAAASAVLMRFGGEGPTDEPVDIRIDRPFLFAIQDRRSGACLFLGRVTDPR